jgi:RHS repeat-associated protein
LSQGYDNQYRISSIITGSVQSLAYGYDANGNITWIVDTINPPGGETIESPGTYTYQQGTNKLAHIGGTVPIDFGYDENANITSETGWTYVYDLSNQLIRVLSGTNQVAEYTYNGAGQRIKKVTRTETRIFHYDLQGHLIAETNQTGHMLAEYIYLGDILLAMIKPGEALYYYHNDHLGTPQVLTDNIGTIAWKAVYTAFGEAVASIETIENPFRFPGQYYDQETGLHYNYFRYYNPQTGRYITPDPIGLEGGINLFAYVANNPVNMIDPAGERVLFGGLGAGGFFGWKKGWLSQVSIGLAFDTTTKEFVVYKSSAATEPPFGTVIGLGLGAGPFGGILEGNMNDFLGRSWEETGYLIGSVTSITTCSGKRGASGSVGGKGFAIGYTDVMSNTTVLYRFNAK